MGVLAQQAIVGAIMPAGELRAPLGAAFD